MASTDDESRFDDPAEALRVIDRERANLVRESTPDPRWVFWPWGLTWFLGFGLFFLRWGPDQRVLVALPDWLPVSVLTLLLVVSGVLTGMVGTRPTWHIFGPRTRQRQMFGFAWSVGFAGLAVVFSQVGPLPEERLRLLWGGGLIALIGTLLVAGAAITKDRVTFGLGLWISVVNMVGVLAGPGWHALIVAVAGGAGWLLAGARPRGGVR